MHDSVNRWIKEAIAEIDLSKLAVLEVGSRDVNGSIRPLFKAARRYTGVDMIEGPGVDMVMNAHELKFGAASMDIIISLEMLEHDAEFWLSLAEIKRVLRPGGWLFLSARGNGFPEHNEPVDCYRFMPRSFPGLLGLAGCAVVSVQEDPLMPGMFGVGRRWLEGAR